MLVSDDRVVLRRKQTVVVASAPSELSGLIEARGIGLLRCDPSGAVPVRVVVDMDTVETARYPDIRTIDLLGLQIPLLRRVDSFHFAPALLQYLKSGRHEE
ncbi:HPr kinase/phosphorylase [Sedimentitalea nanhaiensis]|uniref:HPr kinase/phosphorylase n=2 Tax=Sedimentitalea nanhaiensis TaxID=999627 RepID=A0A1I7BM06_9RHOB|nr:HPr kinase/phosphorylase [Sedimentitalea nanhaiensis]